MEISALIFIFRNYLFLSCIGVAKIRIASYKVLPFRQYCLCLKGNIFGNFELYI